MKVFYNAVVFALTNCFFGVKITIACEKARQESKASRKKPIE
jgi:hypothetical protein